MELVRGTVFDLDDTLYFESAYVRSGFHFVANTIGTPSVAAADIFRLLIQNFESGVRGDSFNRLLLRFSSLSAQWTPTDLVQLYRAHTPEIVLIEGVRELLAELKENGNRLGLITDGPANSQSKKILALGLRDYFDSIHLTDEWGLEFRKPNPRAFETIMTDWGLRPSELVYTGDNPRKDFVAPRALGWRTARLRVKEQQHFGLEAESLEFSADREFTSIGDLVHWLRKKCGAKPERMEIGTK
jgi:putative hydrolase of the HAD superfamily